MSTVTQFYQRLFNERVRETASALMRFSSNTGRRDCPPDLRAPYGPREWELLSGTMRREHVTRRVKEAIANEDDPLSGTLRPFVEAAEANRVAREAKIEEYRAAKRDARGVSEDPAPGIQPPGRYFVSCAGGCGAMLPASGPKPVVKYSGAACRPRPAKRRESVK